MSRRGGPWSKVPANVRRKLKDAVFQRDGNECQIKGPMCNGRAEEIDHIVPVAEDASRLLDVDNLRASCAPCNGGRISGKTAPPSRSW